MSAHTSILCSTHPLTSLTCVQIHTLLQEYYRLDHEDEVGGVRTRFRYRAVEPINDGLTTDQILALPDQDLNAIVGLRKLAPYNQDTHRIRPNYKALSEAREKLVAQGLIVPKGGRDGGDRRGGKKGNHGQKGDVAKGKYKLGSAAAGGEGKASVGIQKGGVVKAKASSKEKGGGDAAGKAGKRPGPRLRRALKEAAAAAAGGVEVTEDGGLKAAGEHRSAGEDVADKGKKKKSGSARDHRKALKEMNADEKKAARLASYAPVAPSAAGGPVRHASGGPSGGMKQQKVKASGGGGGGTGEGGQDGAGDGEFAGMSKAAKKNLKRKLKKRQSGEKAGAEAA